MAILQKAGLMKDAPPVLGKLVAITFAVHMLVAAVPAIAEEATYVCPGGAYTNSAEEARRADCKRLSREPGATSSGKFDFAEFAATYAPPGAPRGIPEIASDAAQRGIGKALLLSIPVALVVVLGLVLRAFRRMNSPRPGDKFFEIASSELEGEGLNKGLWARLYSQHGGDESKTRAAYIRERAKALAETA